MWYPFPFHVTTVQTIYGQGPVLPMTSDKMEAMPIFPEQCHRKCGARKRTGTNQICHAVHKNIHVVNIMTDTLKLFDY